jgi:hypothetical protein
MVVAILAGVLLFAPFQTPVPSIGIFTVPDGPLPWSLPLLPSTIITLSIPSVSLDDVEHTTEYAGWIAELQDWGTTVTAPLISMIDGLDAMVGAGGALPDMSAGIDSDTGLNPNGTGTMTLAEVQTALLGQAETVISYMRLMDTLGLTTVSVALITIFVSIAWMAWIRFWLFAIQLLDALITLVGRLKEELDIAIAAIMAGGGGV